jgi:hypothetical protein
MESHKLTRIALIMTLLGSVYMLGTLVLQVGWVGVVGTAISFLLVAVAFALWSRIRAA